MSLNRCTVCRLATTDPAAYAAVVEGMNTSIEHAARVAPEGIGAYAVRNHFKGVTGRTSPCVDRPNRENIALTPLASAPAISGSMPSMELRPDGSGTIASGDIEGDAPVHWDDLIRMLGGDPATTQVKGDTIRVSARTVLRDGEPVVVRSYSGALAPRNDATDEARDALANSIKEIRSALRTAPKAKAAPRSVKDLPASTFLIQTGDWQLHKGEGGGIQGTLEQTIAAIDGALADFDRNSQFTNYDQVVIGWMGDLIENLDNYANQLATITANLADQMLTANELGVYIVERVKRHTGLPIHNIIVLSNHGELGRGAGGKQRTSTSDSHDRLFGHYLADMYAGDDSITFNIPRGNLVQAEWINGVPVALAHGHNIGPKSKEADIQARILAYDEELRAEHGEAFNMRVFLTGHFHHFSVKDFGPYVHIACPSTDCGSSWYTGVSGYWSAPGLVTMTIGAHLEGGVDNIHFVRVPHAADKVRLTPTERIAMAEARVHARG